MLRVRSSRCRVAGLRGNHTLKGGPRGSNNNIPAHATLQMLGVLEGLRA